MRYVKDLDTEQNGETMYKVLFISKDDHKYEFSTEADSEMHAIIKGQDQILANGWTQYQYVFDNIVKF